MFLCPTNRLWLFSIAIIIHIVRWYVQFLSNLQKHHSAVSYLNFVLHREQTLVEKDSPDSLGTMKSSFSEGQTTLVVFNRSFLVGATNIFSELIHPLLKLLNCVLKQIIRSAWLFWLSPSLTEQAQALPKYFHFHSFLILHKTLHYKKLHVCMCKWKYVKQTVLPRWNLNSLCVSDSIWANCLFSIFSFTCANNCYSFARMESDDCVFQKNIYMLA